jgi:hypothetical protein
LLSLPLRKKFYCKESKEQAKFLWRKLSGSKKAKTVKLD